MTCTICSPYVNALLETLDAAYLWLPCFRMFSSHSLFSQTFGKFHLEICKLFVCVYQVRGGVVREVRDYSCNS